MHECFRLGRLFYLLAALFIAVGATGCATTPKDPSAEAAAQAEKTAAPGRVHHPVHKGPGTVTYYAPPDKIEFSGEPVPLEKEEVMERFDKEFTLVVYNHAQVYQLLKRKQRLFPWLEERLRRLNLPEDLKYVAITEIVPPPNTQRRRSSDSRYDFERSPDLAFQYLAELYRNFKSWPLAIAAYNLGEKRIVDECRAQGEIDCYHMTLPLETERYLFRILAIKAVLSDPTRYGYELPKDGGYR
ncbi:MAG: transglycosylase SLT domain-containing protein [Syntrophobacteraceae bacterium]